MSPAAHRRRASELPTRTHGYLKKARDINVMCSDISGRNLHSRMVGGLVPPSLSLAASRHDKGQIRQFKKLMWEWTRRVLRVLTMLPKRIRPLPKQARKRDPGLRRAGRRPRLTCCPPEASLGAGEKDTWLLQKGKGH